MSNITRERERELENWGPPQTPGATTGAREVEREYIHTRHRTNNRDNESNDDGFTWRHATVTDVNWDYFQAQFDDGSKFSAGQAYWRDWVRVIKPTSGGTRRVFEGLPRRNFGWAVLDVDGRNVDANDFLKDMFDGSRVRVTIEKLGVAK